MHITPSSGSNGTTTVALTVDPASDDRPRGAGVFFTSENSVVQFTVPVFQMKQTDLVVSPDVVPTIGKEGTTLTFTVASHNEYDVDTNCDWITAEPREDGLAANRGPHLHGSRPTRGADAAPGSPSRARRRTFRPR